MTWDTLDRLGIVLKSHNTEEEHVMLLLSHALPCFCAGKTRDGISELAFMDAVEAEIYRDNAVDSGCEFLGFFNPFADLMGGAATC